MNDVEYLTVMDDIDKWNWVLDNKDKIYLQGDVSELRIVFKEDEGMSVTFNEPDAIDRLLELC